jgi:uncharacterized protein (DUF2141 family)
MKYLCQFFCLLASNASFAGDLKLEIHGSGISGKTIYVAVYSADHAQYFPKRDEYARTGKIVATSDSVELLLSDFASGVYAVAVYADINGNNKLDSNILGIPNEPIGMSRDAKGRFGPPSFSDAAFNIADGITPMRIQLH